jgi:hypothetical protein
MIISSIKATIPFGRRMVTLGSGSICGFLFCCLIGGRLSVDGIVSRPLAWEWCVRPGRHKRGGTCHRSRTTPRVALSCLAIYNTELRQVFPGRKHVMRNLAGPSLRCVHISFRAGNNVTGDVYCLRARDRVASIARWSSDVLPYLGPEIIAVMQAARSSAPNDSRTGPRLPFRESDHRILPSMVLSSSLRYSNSRIVGVLNVWVHWRP